MEVSFKIFIDFLNEIGYKVDNVYSEHNGNKYTNEEIENLNLVVDKKLKSYIVCNLGKVKYKGNAYVDIFEAKLTGGEYHDNMFEGYRSFVFSGQWTMFLLEKYGENYARLVLGYCDYKIHNIKDNYKKAISKFKNELTGLESDLRYINKYQKMSHKKEIENLQQKIKQSKRNEEKDLQYINQLREVAATYVPNSVKLKPEKPAKGSIAKYIKLYCENNAKKNTAKKETSTSISKNKTDIVK